MHIKGSRWIKCDLHIHTPASFFHGYGDRNDPETWNKFISDLRNLPPEFKMIGINDYLTLDGYKKVVEAKQSGKLPNIETILPIIEFRINRFAGESKLKRVNFHAIFSDKLGVDLIQTQFINGLSTHYSLEAGNSNISWNAILDESSLAKLGKKIKNLSPGNTSLQNESDLQVGFNNFNVDYARLSELLSNICFKGQYLTAVGYREWSDYRWDNGGAAEKRDIINKANLVFLASDSVENLNTAKKSLESQNVNNRLLDCSDSHYFSDSNQKDRIGHCYSWLKIEPTFEGLKQTIFEPTDRIHFSEIRPDQKNAYHTIKALHFLDSGNVFGEQKLDISHNLTSIIGGKSTGKSLLANLIAKSADKEEYLEKIKKSSEPDPLTWLTNDVDFHVIWQDEQVTSLQGDENRKITYFPQHYLNQQVDKHKERKELNQLLRNVLIQGNAWREESVIYTRKMSEIDQSTSSTIHELDSTQEELVKSKNQSRELGASKDIESNIQKLTQDLTKLKDKKVTDDELLKFNELQKGIDTRREEMDKISAAANQMDRLNLDEYLDERLKHEWLFDNLDLPYDFQVALGLGTNPILASIKPSIKEVFQNYKNKLKENYSALEEACKGLESQLKPLKEKIVAVEPIKVLSQQISSEGNRLEEAKALEAKISALQQNVANLQNKIKGMVGEKLSLQKIMSDVADAAASKTDSSFPYSDDDEKIIVRVTAHLRSEYIGNVLREQVLYKSNEAIRKIITEIDQGINLTSKSIETLLENIFLQYQSGDLEFKSSYGLVTLLNSLLTDLVYLNYDIHVNNDSFSTMSPGKRALTMLRLLIDLDQSKHPIILDQPEDDLDNRSIYEGLARYLKRRKIQRQIIVVTHNPNVVVGADSEFVIVANQSGEGSGKDNEKFRFEYVYGGLENSFSNPDSNYTLHQKGIREHVCEILDGGKAAFEKRESLYRLDQG